ncbi:unnamed protein product [Blepharisma stoltei]|uniref:Rab6 n=1 Tax=Blepharisma stoltei TaxID=1481888 RepID=A0AAU9JD91_9CILI|nr:unnamed protein product [Blepharisma stoltei]
MIIWIIMAGVLGSATPTAKFKLVFLGDIYTGKTSIINRFMNDTFDANYQATIGIDFLSKTIYHENQAIRLQLWDTAGQERFRSLIPNYIRDSSVAIIVFDVTNKQTFLSIDRWVQDVRSERGKEALIVIAGNKMDKVEERIVSYEEASEKAKAHEGLYVETSAKTGDNISQLFKQIATSLTNGKPTVTAQPNTPEQRIVLTNPPQNQTNEAARAQDKKNCAC